MVDLVTSLISSTAVACTFVGLLYIWPYRVRRDPRSIRLRIVSVAITCTLSTILVSYIIPYKNYPQDMINILGISLSKNLQITTSLLPTLILSSLLFLGPLAVLKDTYTLNELKNEFITELGYETFWRDYLIAPLSEEFVFRGVIIALLSSSINNSFIILIISSVIFSAAHTHHYFLQGIQQTLYSKSALFSILIITMIFGLYSGTLFIKSNCLISSISCHIFCNAMGAPDLVTLRQRKKWWYPTIAGVIGFALAFPVYLICF